MEEATASPPSPVAVEMVDESPIEAAEETRDVTPQPGADADELAAEEREPVDDFIGVGAVTNEMAELAEQSELAAQGVIVIQYQALVIPCRMHKKFHPFFPLCATKHFLS